MKSCFCDSTQSFFSEKFKASSMVNEMECECCKNLILQRENRRDYGNTLCDDCVDKLYSPKTCSACYGRISFQDLKDTNVQQQVNKKYFNEFAGELKLCNCFPKYPSQNFSSIQPSEPNEIQVLPQITGKACSYNELICSQKKKSIPVFYSQKCLASNDESTNFEE